MSEYETLQKAWEQASHLHAMQETDATESEEQRTWDELVDFVEANDLNYTDKDPRGPRDADEES